jgi:hypothetical protein
MNACNTQMLPGHGSVAKYQDRAARRNIDRNSAAIYVQGHLFRFVLAFQPPGRTVESRFPAFE